LFAGANYSFAMLAAQWTSSHGSFFLGNLLMVVVKEINDNSSVDIAVISNFQE